MSQRLRSEGIVLIPAFVAIALLVYWGAHGGGYATTTWEPSALLLLGLLAATLAGIGLDRVRLSRPTGVALIALTGYTLWSYLSIAWAAAPGDALDGANRTLLYLLLFTLFTVLPWRLWSALAALNAFALAIGVLAVVTLARSGAAGTVTSMFVEGRLVSPVGYENGSAAFFLVGAIVPIGLAARRELPVALRAVLLASATASLQVSILCESRGWLFSLPIVLLLAVLLLPGRLRLVVWTLPALLGTLVSLPALLHVFERVDASLGPVAAQAALIDAAGHASSVALLVTGAVLIAGFALALGDRRVTVPANVKHTASRVAVGLAVAAAVAGAAIGMVAADGRPDRSIAHYWDRSSGYQPADRGSSRFARLGSNRPDFWRVALDATAAHPLLGLGQDNWSAYYLQHRHTGDQPRWAHSIELRLLAHTGIVGFLSFAAFVAAGFLAALRERRRAGELASTAAAVALLPLVVWLVHGSIDWFWEIPALSGPAFAFLGLGGALMRQATAVPRVVSTIVAGTGERPGERASAPRPPRWRRRTLAVLLGVAGPLVALALALSYIAEREVGAASADWRADPVRAFSRLDRAASLNPLSSRPELVAGVIALQLGEARVADARFAKALKRDGGDWFAWFGRGLAATELKDPAGSRAAYEHARSLDPREPLVLEALSRVEGSRPLTAKEAFGTLRRDVQKLTSSPGGRADA